MKVIEEIAAERRRQLEAEGYDAGHDDGHEAGDLAVAAACYAMNAGLGAYPSFPAGQPEPAWPWGDKAWKPKNPRRDLVRAGALIVAEIERLDRTAFAAADETKATSVPARIGMAYQGGFYAGRISIDGKAYALVVAPKAVGQKILPWKNDWTKTEDTASLNDGFANSEAMNNADHPAAQFCRGLTIAGFTDWYLPSRDELELCYRNLKPAGGDNYTSESRLEDWSVEPGTYNGVDEHGNGHNASSLPPGEAYTAELPAQTAAEAFHDGQPEAFDQRWYWSSAEFDQDDAWGQDFVDGYQGYGDRHDDYRVRAVRKVLI